MLWESESQCRRSLAKDEVHVWQARLDLPRRDFLGWHGLLSSDEQARCSRYHREADQVRFGTARGILRLLLSQYCGMPATTICFTYSQHGKPLLAEASELDFSVSHTDGIAVYALAHGRRVGIDVERVREVHDCDGLVSRTFAAEEVAAYRSLPAEARPRAFFNGWTRKEAFIKALGQGLYHDLTSFAVSLLPGEPARLLRTQQGDPAAWTIHDLTEEDSAVTALAVEGTGLRICRWQWPNHRNDQSS